VVDSGVPGERLYSLPGEHLVGKIAANHILDGRGYEGYLYVTSVSLIHIPLPASESRGAKAFAIDLSEVTGVDAAPRGTRWRDGSLRRRLRVTTASGDPELFVVWRVGSAVELIERARRSAG
jgi:hypothetical protein